MLGKKKEIQGIQMVKEKVKLSLFVDNMILCIKNHQVYINQPLELINAGSTEKHDPRSIIHKFHFHTLEMNKCKM